MTFFNNDYEMKPVIFLFLTNTTYDLQHDALNDLENKIKRRLLVKFIRCFSTMLFNKNSAISQIEHSQFTKKS